MFRVALKSVLGNKIRLAMTALAIVIGVAFVSGTFILTDSIDQAFGNLFTEINEGTDVYVNPVSDIEVDPFAGGDPFSGPTLDEDLVAEVAAVEGVERAEGFVQGYAQIIGSDGEPIGGQGPPTFGFSWVDDSPITLRDGRAPVAATEVAIDAATVADSGFALGDRVRILTADGAADYELVGITGFGSEDNLLGATSATFEFTTAQELFGKVGELDQIAVVGADGVDPDDLAARIEAAVGADGLEIITGVEQTESDQQEISDGLGFLSTALLAFAGVALFVGAFLIVNTFSIIVAQRTREFALLRAIGASGRQIRTVVLVEALVVGVFAATIGFGAGILLSEAMRGIFGAIGFDFPDGGLILLPRTVVVAYVIGVVVTVIAAVAPARRASRISPMEALRDGTDDSAEHIGRGRTIGGLVASVGGAAALLVGLLAEVDNAIALVGAGVAVMFVGVSLLAPYAAAPVANVLGAVPARLGVQGRLARNNAGHNPKRTSSTASALMIGVALVTFVSIFAASATASVNQLFTAQLGADYTLSPSGFGSLIPSGMTPDLQELDETGAVSPIRFAQFGPTDGGTAPIVGVVPDAISDLVDLGVTDGAMADLAGGGVAISAALATEDGIGIGDEVTGTFLNAGEQTLSVVTVFTNTDLTGSDLVVSLDTLQELNGDVFDAFIFVNVADGGDAATTRAAIEGLLEDYPNVQVQDQTELTQSLRDQVDSLLNVMIGLLGLALVIALIGIVNTLALSVFERTREIGLLRAVGMTRRQVRGMIRWESVIVSVFGATLGLVVGAFFGWAVVTALGDDLPVLEFPAGRMVFYLVGAAIAGVVAAILPARRAARLDVLRAVTTE